MRSKKIKKLIGKHRNEINHLRKLCIFVERVPEDGVQMMYNKLRKEVAVATATAKRWFNPDGDNKGKKLVQEYLSTAGVPLKKKQIAELKFLLS